jgi:DNA polymerase III delta subunit
MAKIAAKIPPAAALVGEDVFLQLAGLRELLALIGTDVAVVDMDGDSAQLADVLDEARCGNLFGGGKAVVVRNADEFVKENREQLEEYVAHAAGETMLVLRLNKMAATQRIYKLIEKTGRIIRCEAPKDATNWIVERAKSMHKIVIATDAARLLAELIGNDLGKLDNELAKLALVCKDGRVQTVDVQGAVAFQREREIWDFTNSLGAGETGAALRRWRQIVQLDSSAEYRAVTWLGMWLENVRKALAMMRRGDSAHAIGQAIRIWQPDAAAKFMRTARGMGEEGLAAATDLLAEIDFQTKTGLGDACGNVERFILAMNGAAK